MKFTKLLLTLAISFLLIHPAMADNVERDKKAEALLNQFLPALQTADFEASIKAALPLLHKSMLNDGGNDITADLRRFGFKKAHENANGYANPVKISRVRDTSTAAIGFGPTAEAGLVVDYFIDKKEGTGGMPAPVKVFFPSDGGAPKISYIGSL